MSVQAAACDGDELTGEVPDGAACHLYQQDWGIPVRLRAGGAVRARAGPARHLSRARPTAVTATLRPLVRRAASALGALPRTRGSDEPPNGGRTRRS